MRISQMSRFLLAASAAFLVALPGCKGKKEEAAGPGQPPKRDERVLATIDGEKVLAEDFLNATRRLPPVTRQGLADPEKRKNFLGEFLDDKILFVEAKKRGLDQDPEVSRRVQEYAERLVIQAMRRQIQSRQIDDKMVEDYYNAHKADEFTQERSRFSMILKRRQPGITPADEKKAEAQMEALVKKLKGGADFAKTAQKESEDPSAANGGDLGPVALEMRGPQVAEAGKALKVGDVSSPVNVGYGWVILKRTGAPEQIVVPMDEAKPRIVQKLRIQAIDDFKADAKKNAKVDIEDDVLSSLDLGSGGPGGAPGMNPMQMQQMQQMMQQRQGAPGGMQMSPPPPGAPGAVPPPPPPPPPPAGR